MPFQDPSYNLTNLSGHVYTNEIFAYLGTGGYSVCQAFDTITRLPETQINIFDVTGSVQISFPVDVFNNKLGLVKTARNTTGGFLFDAIASNANYYDSSNNVLTTDSITITADEFKANIPYYTSIISVGNLSTVYQDFANYVANYFNLANPSLSVFFANDHPFNPSDGVFDVSSLYHIIHGDGIIDPSNHSGITSLMGSVTISNLTKMFRYIVDVNPFGNRDPSFGLTAMDPDDESNYGVNDGFLAGDIIFIPNNGFALQLNVNVNYGSTLNNYIQNNSNANVNGNIDTSLNNLSQFHTSYTNTASYIGRHISTPLLFRLCDSTKLELSIAQQPSIAWFSPLSDTVSTNYFNSNTDYATLPSLADVTNNYLYCMFGFKGSLFTNYHGFNVGQIHPYYMYVPTSGKYKISFEMNISAYALTLDNDMYMFISMNGGQGDELILSGPTSKVLASQVVLSSASVITNERTTISCNLTCIQDVTATDYLCFGLFSKPTNNSIGIPITKSVNTGTITIIKV